MRIEKETIGTAHDEIMRQFIKQWTIEASDTLVTEDQEQTIEIPGMSVRVTHPYRESMTSFALQFGPLSLREYIEEIIGYTPDSGFEYTYGNRLWDYPLVEINGFWDDGTPNWRYAGEGDGQGIDQVSDSIINRLTKNPTSRRAIAVTWVAHKDIESTNPPCLQFVQCLIRDGYLNLHAVFRSHDMAGGWGPNMVGLESLQRCILKHVQSKSKISLKQGYIETYSVSAHIYVNHDQVRAFRRHLNL